MSKSTRPVLERILALTKAACGPRGASTNEMAQELGVSTKTIHRDWEFLRDRLLVDLHVVQGPKARYVATDPTGVLPLVKTLAAIRQ